jgi:methylated-DNA-[protein]-cysteine S-methyltransferase
MRYYLVSSHFGELGLVWQETVSGSQIQQVFIPSLNDSVEMKITGMYPEAQPDSTPLLQSIADQMRNFLAGENIRFDLNWINLKQCSSFQTRVLLAECEIPRGWVSTYGRIAARLGILGGARAVGNALARNPFPIIIPCHRVVRANGDLGGYQGGTEMKLTLLRNEGVELESSNRVVMNKVYY